MELARGWLNKPLGEVVTFQRGFDLPSRFRVSGSVPVVSSAGVTDYHASSMVQAPGVITGRYGTIGEVFFLEEAFWPLNTTLFVRDFHGNEPRFIYYMLQRFDFKNFSGKSGVPGVNRNELHRETISLPCSTTEQRAIATALCDVDALLRGLDQLIAKKRDLKQAAMQQLLTGQIRLPGFHDEWKITKLGEIAKLYQPETISQSEFTDAGYPVFGANGVVGMYGRFNHETPQITVSCRGNCGTVNRTQGPAWITGNAMVVNLDEAQDIDKAFVYYALTHSDLSLLVTGSGIPQIVRGPLEAFAILLPADHAEQTAIAEVLSDMDAELAALEARRNKTRDLKQAMMQELLTGKTRLVAVGAAHA